MNGHISALRAWCTWLTVERYHLTTQDRPRVARAIRDQYQTYKDALLGPRGELLAPVVPDFSTVGILARSMDASPITVGELFKE